jgi:hypothetical protein
MEIEFSQHALDQLKIRTRISKAMVREAISSPDQVLDSHKGRKLYQKAYEADTLEVVGVQEDNKIIIITEYMLGQQP